MPALRIATAFAIVLGAVACAACKSRAAGATSDAEAPARRIVSLSPSTTEAIAAIGARALLVGRSRYCDYPLDVTDLPQVGGFSDPNLEAILALAPDLVIGAHGPAGPPLEASLRSHGARTYFPETESFAQIDAMILGLGERTGHEAGARAAVARIHAREEAVAKAVSGLPRPRVLLIFGLEPIVAAGPGSFADALITQAGGDNVVKEGTLYPMLGVERVVVLDPDFVVNAAIAEAHGYERIRKDTPGWKDLRAVQADRVPALRDESVLRPGPRVGDAVAILARAIHPGVAIP